MDVVEMIIIYVSEVFSCLNSAAGCHIELDTHFVGGANYQSFST